MQYEYFYGAQAEQFSFYRIPKALFTEPNFRELSTDAKVLYGILLDRMSLSLKNQWLDAQNKVYIIFTVEEIMDALNCANQKATRLMVELEKQAGLIERKRQGLGRPNLIYVKNFAATINSKSCEKGVLDMCFHTSGFLENHTELILIIIRLIIVILRI